MNNSSTNPSNHLWIPNDDVTDCVELCRYKNTTGRKSERNTHFQNKKKLNCYFSFPSLYMKHEEKKTRITSYYYYHNNEKR